MELRITIFMMVGLIASSALNAATVSTPLSVTLSVGAGSCSVLAAPVAFVDTGTFPIYADGSVTVTCSNGSNYSIGLDGGLHYDGVGRWVDDGNGNSVQYLLFQDASYLTLWGDGVNNGPVLNDVGNGASQTHPVYGAIPGGNFGAGPYSDAVNVSVNY